VHVEGSSVVKKKNEASDDTHKMLLCNLTPALPALSLSFVSSFLSINEEPLRLMKPSLGYDPNNRLHAWRCSPRRQASRFGEAVARTGTVL
jgi:hypothetical protein